MVEALGMISIAMSVALPPLIVSAQKFPSRPVRQVVPAAAGGVTDIVARALAHELGSVWSHPTIVETEPRFRGRSRRF